MRMQIEYSPRNSVHTKRSGLARVTLGLCLAVLGLLPLAAVAQSFLLGTSAILVGPAAGTNSVTLAVTPETSAWTASTNVAWLHLSDSFQSGTGSTNVVFSYDANPGGTRSGTLTIAGQTLTVTQVGSGYVGAQTATLFAPGFTMWTYGVAVDAAGNVYSAIFNQGEVVKWTSASNTVTTVLSGLSNPSDVAVDTGGNLFIACQSFGSIVENTSPIVTGLNGPSGVAVDDAGNVYFTDTGNGAIKEWTPSNNSVTTLVSIRGQGLGVDRAGKNLYFGNETSLMQWNAANNSITELASPRYIQYRGVDVDAQGNVYFCATDNNDGVTVLMKWIAWNNTLSLLALSAGGILVGVAVDDAENVYFSDSYSGVVYELPNAFVDTTPRREGAAAAQDSLPPVVPNTMNLSGPFAPSSDSAWLTITGVTNGVVSFSFPANPELPATGHITLLGQSISVTVGPSYALGTTNLFEGPAAGSDSVVLAVTPNSGIWTATTSAPWLHLTPTTLNGTGSTNVVFSFDANPGATRSGTLTIAGQTLTVTQAGSTYVQTGQVTSLVSLGLSGPYGVAVDGAGNVYIADTYDNTVKEWTVTNDAVTTLVSSGLNRPQGVAVDQAGNVYIADTFNSAIKKWTAANNTVTTLVSSGLNRPQGVAVDGAGNVYIADTFNSAVKEWVATNSNVVTLVSSGLDFPVGVAVEGAGNVYIADTGNSAIKKWTAADNSINTLVSLGLGYPSGVAVDGAGNVYFADADNLVIEKWTAASNTVTALVSSGLNGPSGVAVGGTGNVYFSDAYNRMVAELPYAFVVPTGRLESADAGSDSLAVVLPATVDLLAPFTPTSDELWLTISGITNGVVSFSFPANPGSSRTAHIMLLGQSIGVTQGGLTYSLGTTALLVGPLAGSNSVVLAVAPKTATWTATANAAWLHVASTNQSGGGSTNVVFSFDANPGVTRSGTLTIAGQTLTVTQAGSTYIKIGQVTSLASSGLSGPYGVAVDGAGNVYIADAYDNTIKEWTVTNNTVTTLISSGLSSPSDVAVDGAGNLYIADSGHSAIKQWAPASTNVTALISSGLSYPYDVTVDGAGNVYIADAFDNTIKEWTPANNNVTTLVSSGLSSPSGVAVDGAGNVYIADSGHNAIKQWAPANNNVTTLVSSRLSNPNGVAVDGAGNVYIADSGHNAIKQWAPANNNVITLVSSGLSSPNDVAVDGAGNVYIADSWHNAIKELPYAFVDPTAELEGPAAGSDVLPVVLPATANLLAPFAPTSDQAWLSITGISNGVVSFAFDANTGSTNRTAHITLLGQPISITQAAVAPPSLLGPTVLSNGRFQFAFSDNVLGASFTVLTSTNLSLPLTNWTVVGPATNIAPGLFQFSTDTTNNPQGYYRVRSP